MPRKPGTAAHDKRTTIDWSGRRTPKNRRPLAAPSVVLCIADSRAGDARNGGVAYPLVLDDAANRVEFQIEYAPANRSDTHDTLMMYRVDHWVLERSPVAVGYYDELRQALDECALVLGMPNFLTPATAADGTIITPEEQRERWAAGLDPRTGRSRVRRSSTRLSSRVQCDAIEVRLRYAASRRR